MAEPLVSLPRDQETSGSGDENERKWEELRKRTRTRSLDVAEFSLSVIHARENIEDFDVELRSL